LSSHWWEHDFLEEQEAEKVVRSSVEVEHWAMVANACKITWLKQLLHQ